MAQIEITAVYRVSHDQRSIEVTQFDGEAATLVEVDMSADDLERPFYCTGLSDHDLAASSTKMGLISLTV